MRSFSPLITITATLLAAACEHGPVPLEPPGPSPNYSAQGGHTSVFPNVDGQFGPIVLASCAGGYDLIYEQAGTATVIETRDRAGDVTRLQFVWNLTAMYTNSISGYSISGPSYGPDRTTFNADGSQRFVQVGLIVHLKTPDGIQLVHAGYAEFRIDEDGNFSIVTIHGPAPLLEGFPERPVLCALINH